ncbi:MAG: hypothetical protein GF334_08475 [Candidatus Altiarchaeales archaeon]|nr:hypothetical protein [Candidatus Altiarchaeales archaeon]
MKKLGISDYDRKMVKKTIAQFESKRDPVEIFYDLCLCLCVPQTTFKSAAKVLRELVARNFYLEHISREELRKIVKPVRFLRKADFLLAAKKDFEGIYSVVVSSNSSYEKREALVKRVRGMGMKAGSHFLRNMGVTDLAIIDTHVLKFLEAAPPKSKREYLELECDFQAASREYGMATAELDAYIWKFYSGTPWEEYFA